jgi:hypothetical protein
MLEELRLLVEAQKDGYKRASADSGLREATEIFVKLAEESATHIKLRSVLDNYARLNGYQTPVRWKGETHPYIGPDVRLMAPGRSVFVGEAKRSDTETPRSCKDQLVEHLRWIYAGLEGGTFNLAVYAIAINEKMKLPLWRNAVEAYIAAVGLDVRSRSTPKLALNVHMVEWEVVLPEDE